MQALVDFCTALAATPVSTFIRDIGWMVPLVQTFHILAIAVVFTATTLVAVRVLGLGLSSQPAAALAGRLLPLVWPSLAVLLASGIVLAVGEPERSIPNPVFMTKMALVITVCVLTLVLQRGFVAPGGGWDGSAARRAQARILAVAGLLIWVTIIFAGRWIAYFDPSVFETL